MGIMVELIGVIENCIDKSMASQFLTLSRDLEPPCLLTDNISYDFSFNHVKMPYDTYAGIAIRLRYYINVIVKRSHGNVTKEEDFIVNNSRGEL